MKAKKPWNPKVKKCSECTLLEPIKDKKTGSVDTFKKFCSQWNWEIDSELAAKQAVCREEKPRRSRRRKQ